MAAVLIVEDDSDTARLLRHWLETDGHQVVTVLTGEGALEAVREHVFDLVLLDVRLPGISGYEVARILAAEEETPRILFVTVTDADDIPADLAAGSIAKPFDRDSVHRAVRGVLDPGA